MPFRPTPTTAVSAALAAHVAAGDPHPVYETDAAHTADLAAHTAAGDPHPQYQREGQSINTVGFFGLPVTGDAPTVTGSRAGNAALASLITALESLGLVIDGSS